MTGVISKTTAKDVLEQLKEEGLVLTRPQKRYQLGTEIERKKEGYVLYQKYTGYTGSRAENIDDALASIKIQPSLFMQCLRSTVAPTWSGGSGGCET